MSCKNFALTCRTSGPIKNPPSNQNPRNGNRNNDQLNPPCEKTLKKISKYFWIHGAIGHDDAECLHKEPGHKPSGTFENKMGGRCARFE